MSITTEPGLGGSSAMPAKSFSSSSSMTVLQTFPNVHFNSLKLTKLLYVEWKRKIDVFSASYWVCSKRSEIWRSKRQSKPCLKVYVNLSTYICTYIWFCHHPGHFWIKICHQDLQFSIVTNKVNRNQNINNIKECFNVKTLNIFSRTNSLWSVLTMIMTTIMTTSVIHICGLRCWQDYLLHEDVELFTQWIQSGAIDHVYLDRTRFEWKPYF